jgi:hypothetical protein
MGMLVAEIHALGQTAHIKITTPFRIHEVSAFTAHNSRSIPVRLDTPTMQYVVALTGHDCADRPQKVTRILSRLSRTLKSRMTATSVCAL